MKMKFKYSLAFLSILFFLASCKSVKPYQRKYLNDSTMQMSRKSVASFEKSAHSIREGSSSGESKSSGGCGCN